MIGNKYTELEIGVQRRERDVYTVGLRASLPGSDVEPLSGQGHPAQFDFDQLLKLSLSPEDYGRVLAQSLFADPELRSEFDQVRTAADRDGTKLRVRLRIDASVPELHRLHWETLCDPRDGSPLFVGENILFSRFLLGSSDWRSVQPRPRWDLRALVVIANPSNLAEYRLSPIDVAGELKRARDNLGTIPVTTLPDADSRERATLGNAIAHLRRDRYDIVYVVCHGTFVQDESWLWLEDDAGMVARMSGDELVTELKGLSERPLLIVLASCESAGRGEGEALSALGPSLARAGIPAVLAMQGQISMATVETFMPVFFDELRQNGEIDRAVALARGAARKRPDHWMPVLFMRLKSGLIWFRPRFAGDRDEFQMWPALISSIKEKKCTPIIGRGLVEALLGSSREIAQHWAETFHYPMAPHERESLPQVAQFVATKQNPAYVRGQLGEYLRQEIQRRYGADLPPELHADTVTLDQLIEAIWAQRWERDPVEPHKVLAQLPLPVYITTNLNNLLAKALIDADKHPEVVVCPWNEDIEMAGSIFDREPGYEPKPERPLVYHLFGRLDNPVSVVLAEDDYFDFLIGAIRNEKLFPKPVLKALADTALLFLGFQMDDWNFRVLLRMVVDLQVSRRRKLYTHVAAQIAPEEDRISEPRRAREYLEKFFSGADISIYWGGPDDFLKTLMEQMSH